MAAPRVFISSTFYDMKHVREDVARFVQQLGYDAVLFERGDVAYGSEENLESDCYKEVQLSDIVISIIGGRYGTEAKAGNGSISQHELKTASELKKKIYIFVQTEVYAEYRTFQKNEGNENIKYANVDDPKVYKFLKSLQPIAHQSSIVPFNNSSDITSFLRKQWAGLFQRALAMMAEMDEGSAVQKLVQSVSTLDKLVGTLSDIPASLTEASGADAREGIKAVLLMEHPVFSAVQQLLGRKPRLAFYTLSELNLLMESMRFHQHVDEDSEHYYQWIKKWPFPRKSDDGVSKTIRACNIFMIARKLFDEAEKLIPMKPSEFHDLRVDKPGRNEPVQLMRIDETVDPSVLDDDDDIPF